MKQILTDIETFSEADIKTCGLYRYASDPSFEILLISWTVDDGSGFGETKIADIASGDPFPEELLAAFNNPECTLIAHNASFERVCFSYWLQKQLGKSADSITEKDFLSPDNWVCTMVMAASLSLPLALKDVAAVLKTAEQKDKEGERLIKLFSAPCKPTKSNGGRTRNLPEHLPADWEKFKFYCMQDVKTEADIYERLKRFPMQDIEWRHYRTNERVNDRGVRIDTELVQQAIAADLALSEMMTEKAYALTGLENPNSVSQLKGWLEERGIQVESLGKKDVAAMIDDLDKHSCDGEALDMLKLRLQMAKSSVKKYQAAERCVCADGRAHGLFMFYGASRTGRYAGRLIQLQNLPQNHISTLDEARELVKMGCFDMVESIYGNTPDILSQLIRTMLIPKDGCEFIVADFSAIEARVLAWEAGETWRLDAFKRGDDIYCASASQMFGVPVVKHGVNGELRQKGKVAELACLAYNTPVLTDKGYVPIQYVTKRHLLWDGLHWVKHDGVVFNGFRRIIHYDGLSATEDHLVYTENFRDPMRFGEAVQKHYRLRKKERYGYSPDYYEGFGRVYDILNAGPLHRFMTRGGLVHNCGYGGSTGALISMGALDMGLKEHELPELIDNWREANPKIVQYWWDVEKAAVDTYKTGEEHKAGPIVFQYYSGTLWMELPGGRKLAYLKPKLQPNRFGRMSLTYEGVGTGRKWCRMETYSGRLVENCIAEGTDVLTNRGLVPIEQIGDSDLLWDGVTWVSHGGLLKKGYMETIEVGGIRMTPDHKILTEEGWRKCSEAKGLNWAAVQLPDSYKEGGGQISRKAKMALQVFLRKLYRSGWFGLEEKEKSDKIVRMYDGNYSGRTEKDAWDEPSSGMGRMAFNETAVLGSKPLCLSQLWRPWNYCLRCMDGKLRKLLERYGADVSERNGTGSYRQRWRVFPGKLPLGNEKDKFEEQENKPYHRHCLWEDERGRAGRTDGDRGDNSFISPGTRMAGRIVVGTTKLQKCVYDIRNCGPRHRFCVLDKKSGRFRVVSNCTQAIARDILAEAMDRLEEAGFHIVGHVHDECIVEVPKGKYTPEQVAELMSVNPEWCKELPLAAAGYLAENYYFKD